MNRLKVIIFGLLSVVFIACEEVIDVDTEDVEPSIVIDAFIDDRLESQVINLTYSRNFDDRTEYELINNAEVFIEDLSDPSVSMYEFNQTSSGTYEWIPSDERRTFGAIGHDYQLNVIIEGKLYTSQSTLNPVPEIDSIRFNYIQSNAFTDESYGAEFFAVDLVGEGDTYWVKAFKNEVWLDQPEYLLTSFDGAFSETAEDGLLFIPPVRTGITPIEEEDLGYDIGDVVKVELLSITETAYNYLNEIRAQIDRPGGISELFSVPITNLTGNIFDEDGNRVLGFFCTSSVSISTQELTEELAERAKEDAE